MAAVARDGLHTAVDKTQKQDLEERLAPTPQRQRSPATSVGQPEVPSTPLLQRAATSDVSETNLPAEIHGLTWPTAFCDEPKGDKLELSAELSTARRTSGLSQGVAFVGPLSLERSTAYFEVEIVEIEPNRSQTMAIGLCVSLPPSRGVLRAALARDLGEGITLLGYDLPKVCVNGTEASKISTKQWRPLKDLAVGSRVGLLIDRGGLELTVFVNGVKKASANFNETQRWPDKVWGVVDVHGSVKSVRLVASSPERPGVDHDSVRTFSVPKPPAWASAPAFGTPSRMASTQDLSASTPLAASAEVPTPLGAQRAAAVTPAADAEFSLRRAATQAGLEQPSVLKKRVKLQSHPCGCMVHLINNTGSALHVPRLGDFVIGRNPKCCNLALDSEKVPNMISRRHAVVISNEDAVMIVDCESTNGTFVNGRRVARETLRHGDRLVIGNPAQSPEDFRFEVSMPMS